MFDFDYLGGIIFPTEDHPKTRKQKRQQKEKEEERNTTLRSDLHSLHSGFGKRTNPRLFRSDFTNDVGMTLIFVISSGGKTFADIY